MVSTRVAFSSLDASNGPKILLGDDSETESKEKGRIDLDNGSFNNFLYVPGLATNLFLVYPMTQTRSLNKAAFTPMMLK